MCIHIFRPWYGTREIINQLLLLLLNKQWKECSLFPLQLVSCESGTLSIMFSNLPLSHERQLTMCQPHSVRDMTENFVFLFLPPQATLLISTQRYQLTLMVKTQWAWTGFIVRRPTKYCLFPLMGEGLFSFLYDTHCWVLIYTAGSFSLQLRTSILSVKALRSPAYCGSSYEFMCKTLHDRPWRGLSVVQTCVASSLCYPHIAFSGDLW